MDELSSKKENVYNRLGLMLKIAFIGKNNQTNTVISDALDTYLSAEIIFIEPAQVFFEDPSSLLENYDLVIVDLNTSSGLGNAPKNINKVASILHDTPVLILDHHEQMKFMQPLINAGATGIISSTPSESKLIEAIAQLLEGNTYFDFPE